MNQRMVSSSVAPISAEIFHRTEDFLQELARNKKGKALFATLNKTDLYPIAYRLQTARKPETRAKRMQAMIERLACGEKFH
jgi:uncharacterized protein YdeI (YjbR/CyaY-like superfamily)